MIRSSMYVYQGEKNVWLCVFPFPAWKLQPNTNDASSPKVQTSGKCFHSFFDNFVHSIIMQFSARSRKLSRHAFGSSKSLCRNPCENQKMNLQLMRVRKCDVLSTTVKPVISRTSNYFFFLQAERNFHTQRRSSTICISCIPSVFWRGCFATSEAAPSFPWWWRRRSPRCPSRSSSVCSSLTLSTHGGKGRTRSVSSRTVIDLWEEYA